MGVTVLKNHGRILEVLLLNDPTRCLVPDDEVHLQRHNCESVPEPLLPLLPLPLT